MNRRTFLALVGASAAGALNENSQGESAQAAGTSMVQMESSSEPKIDRHSLVSRHNVVLKAADIMSPLSVGNGEFAFTADVTGLQTFEEDSNRGIPASTMAQWGFHTPPNPTQYTISTYPLTTVNTSGRPVEYVYYQQGKCPAEWEAAANYLYSTPGRLHLGRIGMILKKSDGSDAGLSDITDIHQELDLWSGVITSRFAFQGIGVTVATCCHPLREQIAVKIQSDLLSTGRLTVFIAFPYGSTAFNGNGADWGRPDAHHTTLSRTSDRRVDFARALDSDRYFSTVVWKSKAALTESGPHRYTLATEPGLSILEFTASFSRTPRPAKLPTVNETFSASKRGWKQFWSTGGAIDLSGSKDPRWLELERRIVLSQYLTRIQCAGSLPPQETGLTCNSWFGKFHLEMHWWHAAHFSLWGRTELLERSLPYYMTILPKAQATAKRQGYEGARWPKCVGPAGDPGPTFLECFLIWQQPHPIFYSELCYRAKPTRKTLEQHQEIVFETAKFMATFAVWDEATKRYRIGPPISDAAEIYWDDHVNQWNPTFEVAYWRWALEAAQRWRERLGLGRDASWDHVIDHLPPLAVREGLYVAADTATETFATPGRNTSHPCLVAPLGMLDGAMVDRTTMDRTLTRILTDWDWNGTWGWDYPLLAMTAAKLGRGDDAVDMLLKDVVKNTYLPNGHNLQDHGILPIYLPGNGGLLYVTAMMVAGWENAPKRNAPGFPNDGSWKVRHEGILPAP